MTQSGIMQMGAKRSLGHRMTLEAMPILMIIGAIVSLGGGFGFPPVFLMIIVMLILTIWLQSMHAMRIEKEDLRFLLIPAAIFALGGLTKFHLIPAFHDQAYHLQISNRILDRWIWLPTHQGMSYSFRPEIVSGIAAVEMWLTGSITTVIIVPTLLLISTAWSIQHLSEHLSSRRIGVVAGLAFCILPVTVMFGRTMLLDTALAGMVVSVFHHLELSKSKPSKKHFFLGMLLVIVGMTKYPYLYLGPWITVLYLLARRFEMAKLLLGGYTVVLMIFMIKNIIHTGAPFGPLQSQISGTMASFDAVATGSSVYTFDVFLDDFINQWNSVLLCFALLGTVLLIKIKNNEFTWMWIALLPAIVLHGYILDFGWERYSTPWFALLCVAIPGALVHVENVFGERIKNSKIPVMITVVLMLTTIQPVIESVKDMRQYSENLYTTRDSLSDIYAEAGMTLPDDSVIITGLDITMGLHAQTPAYRYEDPDFPMLQAIAKFNATHAFTHNKNYRYDIDVNATFLFGSPIDPVQSFESNGFKGWLWKVNQSRLVESDSLQNTTLSLSGGGVHSGDFIWLKPNSNVDLPEGTSIRAIYETNNSLDLSVLFDVLSKDRRALLCDDVISCSEHNREDHIENTWGAWLTNHN